jgi:hypothetical protein
MGVDQSKQVTNRSAELNKQISFLVNNNHPIETLNEYKEHLFKAKSMQHSNNIRCKIIKI